MMMMNLGGSRSSSSSRQPFTTSQWQELEHQALIYKYMASGQPIPADLILRIRRSFLLDSIATTSPTLAFPLQPTWMGSYGVRKGEDPEPGRCRRTDGKKWRCSKEAHPDSKYCERHMHRGKNRSRKPVEIISAFNSSNINGTTKTINSSSPKELPTPLSLSSPPQIPHHDSYHHHHQTLYPYPSPRPFANHPNPTLFHLDPATASYSTADKDYRRYCHEMKDVDEYSLVSGGGERVGSWEFRPLGISSLGEPKQSHSPLWDTNYSFPSQLSSKDDEKEQQQQHCFILGAEFKLEKPLKEGREQSQRPLRHFFNESPEKNKVSWMDLEDGNSKTQLSISMAHHDFIDSGSQPS